MQFTRPGIPLTLASLATLGLLLALGFWQLDRMGEKRDLIARIAARTIAAPLPAPEFAASPNFDLEYRQVFAGGSYRHDLEIPLYAIGPGGLPGYRIYTPLQRPAGDSILVNRGWVPPALQDPALRPEGLPSGAVTVQGVLRLAPGKARFTPENQPAKNAWYWLDMELIAAERGLENLAYYVIQLTADPDRPGPPYAMSGKPKIANNHLGYVLTWFSLALALVVMFAIYHRREAD
jgi:surfeit locus 1 family protein